MDIVEAFNIALNEDKQQERIVKSNLEVMIRHMLKCKYQNEYPTKSSWRDSIKNSFKDMVLEFKDIGKGALYKNFYLRKLNLDYIYKLALKNAINETGKDKSCFPATCEWTKEQLTNIDFIYDFIDKYGQDTL